jgi:uncharacterized protein (TIGR02996 family)
VLVGKSVRLDPASRKGGTVVARLDGAATSPRGGQRLSDRNAFLRAICEQPADDAPRLVFADWLDENGEPDWADFIRVQCDIWDITEGDHAALCCVKGCSAWPIGQEYRCKQCRPCSLASRSWALAPTITTNNCLAHMFDITCRRGFVAEVACPLGDWLDHGKAICEQHPVERVRITDRVPYFGVSDNDWSWIYTPPNLIWDDKPRILPYDVWRLLDQHDTSSARMRAKRYRTREHALARLNVAALTWARKQAGLPPLKEKQA